MARAVASVVDMCEFWFGVIIGSTPFFGAECPCGYGHSFHARVARLDLVAIATDVALLLSFLPRRDRARVAPRALRCFRQHKYSWFAGLTERQSSAALRGLVEVRDYF